jgi:hypothetical protein
MANRDETEPNDRPDARLMPLVTALSRPPNKAGSNRAPIDAKGEFGSDRLLAA